MKTFDALTRGDKVRPVEEDQTKGSCLFVTLREWDPAEFQALRRRSELATSNEHGTLDSAARASC